MTDRDRYLYLPDCVFAPPNSKDIFQLQDQHVHLWWADLSTLETELEQWFSTLSQDERQKAERFRFEQDRNRFVLARGVLRTLLSAYLGVEAQDIAFSYGSQGKPAIASPTNFPIQFNLSHSQDCALYGIARTCAIGVDLEQLRPVTEVKSLAGRFFSTQEHQVICSLTLEHQQNAFFRLWTAKEAYLKTTGQGLSGLETIEFLCRKTAFDISGFRHSSRLADVWTIIQFQPCPDSIAAVSIAGLYQHLHCFQFNSSAIR